MAAAGAAPAYELRVVDGCILVAQDAAGATLACFPLARPEQAADESFLAAVRLDLEQRCQRAEAAAAGAWGGDASDAELDALLAALAVGSGGAAAAAPPPPRSLDGEWPPLAAAAGDDRALAQALQAQERAAEAVARRAAEEADAAAAAEALSPASRQAHDAWLARQWQAEEDAALAAQLAAQEEAAAAAAQRQTGAAAASGSSHWARLPMGGGAAAPSPAPSPHKAAAGAADPFPSLQAAAAASSGARPSDATRQLLLQQHRSAQQARVERCSGVRLLRRGTRSAPASPEAAAPPPPARLPPLRLEGGLAVLDDDLDIQLLLKDPGVTAAAKAAASGYASREAAAAGGAGAGAASAEALRSMMDAAAGGRPGTQGAGRPGSAAGEGAGAAAGPPARVDTKSLRRLVDDMRSRGWLVGAHASAGGHIRCERRFADLPGLKQVFFLCSTPSDVNYVWNVAAAVKRFDREAAEARAAAAAAPS